MYCVFVCFWFGLGLGFDWKEWNLDYVSSVGYV